MKGVCECIEKLRYFCVRVQGVVCRACGKTKVKRRSMKISRPFDFKHVSSTPAGYSEDTLNVLRDRAAASRMVSIEDQRPHLGALGVVGTGADLHPPSSAGSMFPSGPNRTVVPHKPLKTRSGYRGLAASTAGRGFSYSTIVTTESRPSVTRSFAVTDEATLTSLTPSSSVASVELRDRRGRFPSSI